METNELIQKLKEKEYKVFCNNYCITVNNDKGTICSINKNKLNCVEYYSKINDNFKNIINTYIKTKPKDRAKGYFKYLYKKSNKPKIYSYLNINYFDGKTILIGSEEGMHEWKTVFEENDPLLEDIDLSDFEKIKIKGE